MDKLFSCKAKNNKNFVPVKRNSASENMETEEMHAHSSMQMDEATRLRETIAKGSIRKCILFCKAIAHSSSCSYFKHLLKGRTVAV